MDKDGLGDNSDPDRDGDRISNDYELTLNTDPNDPRSVPADQDGDQIPDALDDDRDGDKVANDDDAFPDDKFEWADLDKDGIGDNSDSDRDGDGYSNSKELAEKTDPNDFFSYPDHIKPVLEKVDFANSAVTGMAYDDGMGVARIWAEDSAGQAFEGKFLYTSHFRISIPESATLPLKVKLQDKAGNQISRAVP